MWLTSILSRCSLVSERQTALSAGETTPGSRGRYQGYGAPQPARSKPSASRRAMTLGCLRYDKKAASPFGPTATPMAPLGMAPWIGVTFSNLSNPRVKALQSFSASVSILSVTLVRRRTPFTFISPRICRVWAWRPHTTSWHGTEQCTLKLAAKRFCGCARARLARLRAVPPCAHHATRTTYPRAMCQCPPASFRCAAPQCPVRTLCVRSPSVRGCA